MIGRPDFDRHGAEMASDTIPCLSIRQPYAWLIVQGFKPVENRTWRTNFRGRVLIHAGVTYPKRDYATDFDTWGARGYPSAREEMVGGIVGEALIVDCVKAHPSPFFFGPYGFVLEQPKAYPKLIPLGGRLGFFGVPAAIVDGMAEPTEAQAEFKDCSCEPGTCARGPDRCPYPFGVAVTPPTEQKGGA